MDFLLYSARAKNYTKIEKIRTFKNKSDAITYLFLFVLRGYFFDKYIVPSRDWGYQINNLQSLKIKMSELGIPDHYICGKENLKEHSICYYKTEEGWFQAFIGTEKKVIAINKKGFEETFFFENGRISLIHSLYLLDNYIKEIFENSNIILSFSDYEIANYLGYQI